MLDEETIDENEPLTIFDPNMTWRRMTVTNFKVRELLVPIFENGMQVYESPSVLEIRDYCRKDLDTFWDEYKRFSMPHIYKVDLSDGLYALKQEMIQTISRNKRVKNV